MTSPMLELQGAIVQRLKQNGLVASLIADRVYDEPPESPTFPYVSFGPSDERPQFTDCVDSFEINFQIDCWSRSVGFPEVRKISDAIQRAMKADFSLNDNAVVYVEHIITRTFRDPDGLTSHAAINFEAVIEQP